MRPCTKPYAVKLEKRTNEELKSHTKTYLKVSIIQIQILHHICMYLLLSGVIGLDACFQENMIVENVPLKTYL